MVYDSAHGKLSSSTKKVIADLVMMQSTAISVYFVDVQWQSDGSECALFAIAFVADLCTSEDPASSRYDQMKMRNHLNTCLVTGKSPLSHRCTFPLDGSSVTRPVWILYLYSAFADYQKCHEWYRKACVIVADEFFENGQLP